MWTSVVVRSRVLRWDSRAFGSEATDGGHNNSVRDTGATSLVMGTVGAVVVGAEVTGVEKSTSSERSIIGAGAIVYRAVIARGDFAQPRGVFRVYVLTLVFLRLSEDGCCNPGLGV